MIESFATVLAVLVVIGQVIGISGLSLLFVPKKSKLGQLVATHLTGKTMLILVYIVSMAALLGSLYYSDIRGFTPCKLCWYQRILMYPQALMYLIALAKDDLKIGIYGFALSAIGFVMAIYHYLLQIGVLTTTSCGTVGFSVACSDRFTTTFGYITIPLMAATGFFLIMLGWAIHWRFAKN